jgi:hypothetical protein
LVAAVIRAGASFVKPGTGGMTDDEKVKGVLNYCRAMSQKTAEFTHSVPWKWWAKDESGLKHI